MKEIDLKTAIKIIETPFVKGKLQTFSIEHGYADKDKRHLCTYRPLCSRVNPYDSEKDFLAITEKNGNGQLKKDKKTADNVFKNRIIRIFDLQEKCYKSIKIDLLIAFNGMVVIDKDNIDEDWGGE